MAILILMGVTVFLAVADILIKSYVEGNLVKGEERRLSDKVVMRKVYNKGFCLNFLSDRPETVRIASAFAAVLLTIYQLITLLRKKKYVKKVGLSLMTAGAWSNTFDRWIRGYVIDYVGFRSRHKKLSEITYNLGDFFIGAGAVLVVLSSLFRGGKKKSQ